MVEQYEQHGVRFLYPGNWELDEKSGEGEVTISVNSPETSFWSLSLYYERPDPELLVEKAVDAFRDEYAELDQYPAEVRLCRRETAARDVEFVCLELINGAFLRAFQTPDFTALVLYQGTDHELAHTRQVMEGISASLECEEQ